MATIQRVRFAIHRSGQAIRNTAAQLAVATAVFALAACAGDSTSPNGTIDAGGNNSSTPLPVTGNPISGMNLWVDPNSSAKQTADSWRATRPGDAAQIDKIASGSQAQWFGEWNGDVFSAVSSAANTAATAGAVPVLVAYNIPQRDCGGLSAGGVGSAAAYKTWIAAFANGLVGHKAVVILEPDALTQTDCLSSADLATRMDLIQYAVSVLKSASRDVAVYLDGGHSAWRSPSDQASRLQRANVAGADGFALNVSNFQYTSNLIAYGKSVSALIGGKHFVIDTSRNGLGPTSDNQWCNPAGRGLGFRPTTLTADPLVDAYLWIKTPGESDGACNGAPVAGQWWADYALGLAERSV
ncbi:MAG: glycoside hydrolase family 6 protein [Gemmatimonadaceae bacterium]